MSDLHEIDTLEVRPLTAPVKATIRVPGSKSITNRALILAALHSCQEPCVLRGALRSEDTEVMIAALQALGFEVRPDWDGAEPTLTVRNPGPGLVPAASADLFLANSGTSMRFLTALVSLGHGRYRLDGVERMRERPIEDLLEALCQLGVAAGSEAGNGCPPVIVEANGLRGGKVRIKGTVSSQFLSALLLAAPSADGELVIEVEGDLVSWPYVSMTVAMMQHWGLVVEATLGKRLRLLADEEPVPDATVEADAPAVGATTAIFHVPGRQQAALASFTVEPDASGASYFFGAAAVSGGEITVAGLGPRSLQGDIRFVDVLQKMGCQVERGPAGLTVRGGPLRGVDVDMNDISDCVMTLAAVACFAQGATTIRNVGHIRHKETDRLQALANELQRLGAKVWVYDDGLTIFPQPLHGAGVETYKDHRMAMSLSLIGLKVPGVVIKDPGCVGKTYPGFFADLDRIRVISDQ